MPAIVTFDFPLWYKAMLIKHTLGLEITILLGNFHLVMAFLKAIGYIMQGTGLEAILEREFSKVVVKDIMAGKNYRRCLRGLKR